MVEIAVTQADIEYIGDLILILGYCFCFFKGIQYGAIR